MPRESVKLIEHSRTSGENRETEHSPHSLTPNYVAQKTGETLKYRQRNGLGHITDCATEETCYYSPQQITGACKLCMNLGVDWVKSSTGCFGGATPEAVLTMLEAVNGGCQVKASGGIKTYETACFYLMPAARGWGSATAATRDSCHEANESTRTEPGLPLREWTACWTAASAGVKT